MNACISIDHPTTSDGFCIGDQRIHRTGVARARRIGWCVCVISTALYSGGTGHVASIARSVHAVGTSQLAVAHAAVVSIPNMPDKAAQVRAVHAAGVFELVS